MDLEKRGCFGSMGCLAQCYTPLCPCRAWFVLVCRKSDLFFLVGFGLLQGFPVIDSVHTFYGQNIDLLPKVEEFKYLRLLFTSVGRVECETVGWIGVAV